MTKLDNILKIWDITLLTKVHLVKAMVFPVIMYGCESWTIKNAEHRRIDAFELWCCIRLSRVLWTGRRSNQSIKEINSEYSLEKLILKLKLQYFRHLMWELAYCKDHDSSLYNDWRQEEKEMTENEMVEWHHQHNGHKFEQTPGDSEGQISHACCSPRGHKEPDTTECLNSNTLWSSGIYPRDTSF